MRETPEECVLVLATRAPATVRLPSWMIPGARERLTGTGSAVDDSDVVSLSSPDIGFTAWRLPGVEIPSRILTEPAPEASPVDVAG